MKKYLTAFLLTFIAFSTQAGIIAKARNKSGGDLALTDAVCSKGGGHVFLARAPSGQTAFGCYAVDSGLIIVRYDDGTTYTYESSSFTFTNEAQGELNNMSNRRPAPGQL